MSSASLDHLPEFTSYYEPTKLHKSSANFLQTVGDGGRPAPDVRSGDNRRTITTTRSRQLKQKKTDGYLLGSYRIATAPELNSSLLTSFKSIRLDSPANNVGPWPASLGCTTNSYSSIKPSSANARGSFTPPVNSPLPDSCLSSCTALARSPR